jgi:hypothetical protein
MSDARRFLTAEERLEEVQRDRKALRRERLIREVAGPVWHRMVKVVRETVIEALKSDAVFAVDTAMRLAHGVGFLASPDIQAYLSGDEPLERLAAAGLISTEPYFDTTLVRPWPGPPRLLGRPG